MRVVVGAARRVGDPDVVPRSTANDRPSTALTIPSSVVKRTRRSCTSSSGSDRLGRTGPVTAVPSRDGPPEPS